MRSVFLRSVYSIAGLLLFGALAACNASQDPAQERLRYARADTGDVVIGAPWPWGARGSGGLYGEGLDLAVEEINAAGGVLGRRLRIMRVDDQESVNEGRVVAQMLVDNPEVVGVIGHLQSYVTIPATVIYDAGGLVTVSPFSTSPKLTRPRYTRVFRTTFNDKQRGQQIAELAHQQGFERLAILYIRDAYGRDLANAFEKRASELDLNVVDRQSYTPAADPLKTSIRTVLQAWKDLEIDGIFMAASLPEAGVFVAQIRRAGITVPIIGGDAMDAKALLEIGGEAAEGTIVASSFHAEDPRPTVQRFVRAFREEQGKEPDWLAAAGYDAVHMLAYAMEEAGTLVPDSVAAVLHAMSAWEGATGTIAFDEKGDRSSATVVAKVVRNGQFEYLEALASAPPVVEPEAVVAAAQ